MNNKILQAISFFSLLLFPVIASAQDELILPVRNNAAIKNKMFQESVAGVVERNASAAQDTLFLPFFDDFSRYTVWPSAERWTDSAAFVNFNFPINPPTVGAATFDGLDMEGNPYNNSSANAAGLCDNLTSRPLNLFNDINGLNYQASDSIFLVFQYQRKGRGDNPEANDSLVLQFWNSPLQQWNRVWSATGATSGDTIFTKVKISINDPDYRQNGFRFRFRNYGSLTGLLDIWNVDYITLNKFLPPDYENIRDYAYVNQGPSLLNNYSSLPWKHYSLLPAAQQESFVKTNAQLTVRNNNHGQPFPIKIAGYSYDQYGSPFNIVGGGGLNSIQIPLNTNVTPPATLLDDTFFQDPTTGDLAYFTAVYELGQTTSGTVDDYPQNDTLHYVQTFHNYYAYDDGSAELGYGVSGAGAQLAYKFELLRPDTLRAVNIFFAQLGTSVTNQLFRLAVWIGAGAGPVGSPVYQKFNQSPNYTDSINGFYTYLTDDTFLPAGTYYFGFIQNNATILNLGLDVNTPADPSRKFINTNGSWVNSQLPGMWMIRPVFSGEPLNVGIEEENAWLPISVHPNPVQNNLQINFTHPVKENFIMHITDIAGRTILSGSFNNSVDVSGYSNGVYFLHIYHNVSGEYFTARFIVAGH